MIQHISSNISTSSHPGLNLGPPDNSSLSSQKSKGGDTLLEPYTFLDIKCIFEIHDTISLACMGFIFVLLG